MNNSIRVFALVFIISIVNITLINAQPYLDETHCGGEIHESYPISLMGLSSDTITLEAVLSNANGTISKAEFRGRFLQLSSFENLIQYGTPYELKIRELIAPGQWGEYGRECSIIVSLPETSLISEFCGTTMSNKTQLLQANVIPNADKYRFKTYNLEGILLGQAIRPNPYISSKGLPGLEYGSQVMLAVEARVNGVWSAEGDRCPVALGEVPHTFLREEVCGRELNDLKLTLSAYRVNEATRYRFVVLDDNREEVIEEIENNKWFISVGKFKNLSYRSEYEIRVDILLDGVWQEGKQYCRLITPSIPPITRIKSDFCGIELQLEDQIEAVWHPWVESYQYELSDTLGSVLEVLTLGGSTVKLTQFTNIISGKAYWVRMRVQSTGFTYGDWGDYCTIYTAALPTEITLRPQYCNLALLNLRGSLEAENISQADGYKFMIRTLSGDTLQVVERANRYLPLNALIAGVYGEVYNVQVSYKYQGIWSPYGSTCELEFPESLPKVQLQEQYCGQVLEDYSARLRSSNVSNAEEYLFAAFDPITDTLVSQVNQDRSFVSLHQFYGLENETTYAIKVNIRIGSKWSGFGSSCMITTPSVTNKTRLISYYCGQIYSDLGVALHAEYIAGSTSYTFGLFDASTDTLVSEVVKSSRSVTLSEMPNISYNKNYLLRVKAKLVGIDGIYGDSCLISIGHPKAPSLKNQFCGRIFGNKRDRIEIIRIAQAETYTYSLREASNPNTIIEEVTIRYTSPRLRIFSNIQYGQSYLISVKSNLSEEYGQPCLITMADVEVALEEIPPTLVESGYCKSPTSLSDIVRVYRVPNADSYRFALLKQIDGEWEIIETVERSSVGLSWKLFDKIRYNEYFGLQVDVKVNDEWVGYGPICEVMMPMPSKSSVRAENCGIRLETDGDLLRYHSIDKASKYTVGLFSSINDTIPLEEIERNGLSFNMRLFSSVVYGKAYFIRIKATTFDLEGEYGEACSVSMPDIPEVNLLGESCGIMTSDLYTLIRVEWKARHEGYTFALYDLTGKLIEEVRRNGNAISLNSFSSIEYGNSYQIRAKVHFNDSLYSEYGEPCEIKINNIPSPSVLTASCNQIVTNPWDFQIKLFKVNKASTYTYSVWDQSGNTIASITRNSTTLPLRLIEGLLYDSTYYFAARSVFNGIPSAYSDTCSFTLPPLPTPEIEVAWCGRQLQTPSNLSVKVQKLPFIDSYVFGLFNSSDSLLEEVSNLGTTLSLKQFSMLEYGESYSIKVKAITSTAETNYSTSCNFMMPDELPETNLYTNYCGLTRVNLSQRLVAYTVAGASQYTFGLYGTNDVLLEEVVVSSNSIYLSTFTNIESDQSYMVRVKASNPTLSGEYGKPCKISIAELRPTAPTNLVARGISASEVTLEWEDQSEIEGGYYVEMFNEISNRFERLATLGANQSSYIITDLPNASSYFYRVNAFSKPTSGEYSNIASATTLTVSLLVPEGGQIFCSGFEMPITWTGSPVYSSNKISISITAPDGTKELIANRIENRGKFTWEVPENQDGEYYLTINRENGELLDSTNYPFQWSTGCIQPYLKDDQFFANLTAETQHERFHETRGALLCFKVPEQLAISNGLSSIAIHNWEREVVKTVNLLSPYGDNNYVLNLDELGIEQDTIDQQYYSLEMNSMSGMSYILRFTRTEAPTLKSNIIAYATQWDCKEIGATTVDFHAEIEGGISPYQVSWDVLPDNQIPNEYTSTLRKSEQVLGRGREQLQGSSWLSVQDVPGYLVSMKVTDACGQTSEQLMRIECEQSKKAKSTFGIKVITLGKEGRDQ